MLCSLEHNNAEAEGLTATNIMRQYWTLIQMAARDDCCLRHGTKAQKQTSPDRAQLVLGFAAIAPPREIGGW